MEVTRITAEQVIRKLIESIPEEELHTTYVQILTEDSDVYDLVAGSRGLETDDDDESEESVFVFRAILAE